MAYTSAMYTAAKEDLLDESIGLSTDNLRGILVKDAGSTGGSSYTYSAAHTTENDITGGASPGLAVADKWNATTASYMTGKTFTGGVFDGHDPTFSSYGSSGDDNVNGIVLSKYVNATLTNNPLLCILAITATAPNGGDITVNWHATSGIFYL